MRTLNIGRSTLEAAQINLQQLYTTKSNTYAFENQVIEINWQQFRIAVEQFSGVSFRDRVILKFIHRLSDKWFLTLECCNIDHSGYIKQRGSRFDLTPDGDIVKSKFVLDFDETYFSNVRYMGDIITTYNAARSFAIPYVEELRAGAVVNDLEGDKETKLLIYGCAFDHGSLDSRIRYPHTSAFAFKRGNGDLLIDNECNETSYGLMPRKAYDMSSPCPTRCEFFEFKWLKELEESDSQFKLTEQSVFGH